MIHSASLLEELYKNYQENPASVAPDWAAYFRDIERGEDGSSNGAAGQSPELLNKGVAVQKLMESYRRYGHLAANLDPLGMQTRNHAPLEPALFNLTAGDMDTVFDSGVENLGRASLRDIIAWFEKTYCGSIGAEHSYIRNPEERNWIQDRMESVANSDPIPTGARLKLFEKIYQAEYFEKFLAQKYVGKKRFSLEGGETLIGLLDTVIEAAGRHGMETLVLSMAHRGRLNVLVNAMDKPASMIFAEFDENFDPDTQDYADVKYHLGFSVKKMTRAHKEVHLSLAFNPSHLEAAGPVVLGSTRARQYLKGDTNRMKNMPILIHGDAAFAGQGVVAESLNCMNLEGYRVGGALHIVVNNQIGFTTLPNESRSTEYATDVAKGFQLPIFHVNADDPEAVFRVVQICMDYRQKFQKDMIIDMICYRRLGHNETDEPAFTQALMYDRIKKQPTTAKVYERFLATQGDVTQEDLDFIKTGTEQGLQRSFQKAKSENIHMAVDTMKGAWAGLTADSLDSEPQTRLLSEQMERIVAALTTIPADFTPHPKLKRFIENRKKMFRGEIPIDWGFAEALAFGSILENNHHIRLSGQDSQRGTFSHRHAVLGDIHTGEKWTPVNHISENQAELEVWNSPLSEYAVLGYEFGYSLSDPNTLVLWEAQFGDFANAAQIIFDQFISCSEVKWYRMSGLVMLLPHGYEGQGPEHSSARLERYLQLCANNNIQVCNCTTPAQYFHLLRRQILRSYRKPLVIMSPKSLLRLHEAGSTLDDLGLGVFQEVMFDATIPNNGAVSRVVLCSGKVYYDLLKDREARKRKDIALVRMEQLYPYPEKQLAETLAMYENAKEYFWVQEEPENQGSWLYLEDRLKAQLGSKPLKKVARRESASPAAGMMKVHQKELKMLLEQALGG